MGDRPPIKMQAINVFAALISLFLNFACVGMGFFICKLLVDIPFGTINIILKSSGAGPEEIQGFWVAAGFVAIATLGLHLFILGLFPSEKKTTSFWEDLNALVKDQQELFKVADDQVLPIGLDSPKLVELPETNKFKRILLEVVSLSVYMVCLYGLASLINYAYVDVISSNTKWELPFFWIPSLALSFGAVEFGRSIVCFFFEEL